MHVQIAGYCRGDVVKITYMFIVIHQALDQVDRLFEHHILVHILLRVRRRWLSHAAELPRLCARLRSRSCSGVSGDEDEQRSRHSVMAISCKRFKWAGLCRPLERLHVPVCAALAETLVGAHRGDGTWRMRWND